MRGTFRVDFVGLFRLRAFVLLSMLGVTILAGLGAWKAACGLVIGGLLFILNCFFLFEAGRSLLSAANRARGGVIAALASFGRFAFLGVGLSLTVNLGQGALFAAMGGLVLGQALLHFGNLRRKGMVGCSNI